jgi:hypothetical protein
VRDALARLRSQTELPEELPPDLIELARLCAGSRCELAEVADAWLVGPKVFCDRFQIMAERTLTDTALCWDVIKAARVRLRGHPARLSGLFRRASERELARVAGIDEESRLRAVLRALDGQWVDPDELGYDLAGYPWGWLGGPTRISEADLDALIASQGSSEARVAFGEPAEGIAGFAVSHHQALEARAVAVAANQRAVRFADVRL